MFNGLELMTTTKDNIHFGEQVAVIQHEVTLALTGARFRNGVVTDAFVAVQDGAKNVTAIGKDSTTAAGNAAVPSKKAFKLKGAHHIVDNLQFDLGSQPLNCNTTRVKSKYTVVFFFFFFFLFY
jgi:hypothetical protein